MSNHVTQLDFASRLWGFFRSLIERALAPLTAQWGDLIPQVMVAIYQCVDQYFVQALQLDPLTLRLETT